MMKIEKLKSLRTYNTFGLEVRAELFARWTCMEDVLDYVNSPELHDMPLLILGGGSNVLFVSDIDGFTAINAIKGISIVEEDKENVFVQAGSGELWHELVLWAIGNNLGGIENLSLIPGCVGAAPMQNIGAYGVELKDVFHSLEAINLHTGKKKTFYRDACEFGYRSSVFKTSLKNQFVIESVTLKLSKHPVLNTAYGAIKSELTDMSVVNPTIKDVSEAVMAIRRRKLPDPAEIGNSGSFFKNPVITQKAFDILKKDYPDLPGYPASKGFVKVPAGWLIDTAGWKGKRFGNYGVHKNQALVLVNYGGASGRDIWQLSEDIRTDIYKKFNISLEREVNVVGKM